MPEGLARHHCPDVLDVLVILQGSDQPVEGLLRHRAVWSSPSKAVRSSPIRAFCSSPAELAWAAASDGDASLGSRV